MTKDLEYKAFKITKKELDSADGIKKVSGYASTWDVDQGGDKILPGAFADTIQERFIIPKAAGYSSQIKFLYQHTTDLIIGRVLSLKEDEKGLFCELEFFTDPDIPEARKAYALAKLGELDSFSIGFKCGPGCMWIDEDDEEAEAEYGEGVSRVIKSVVLYEISLVTFPMNKACLVTAVKKEGLMKKEDVELTVHVEVKGLDELVAKLDSFIAVMEQKNQEIETLKAQLAEVLAVKEEIVEEVVVPEVKEETESSDDLNQDAQKSFAALEELINKASNLKLQFTEDK